MTRPLHVLAGALGIAALAASVHAAPPGYPFVWSTVANNGDYMPTDTCDPASPVVPPCRRFSSYNQPSVNVSEVVVMRARSRGGQGMGQPVHGVYSRDMAAGGPVVKLFDRNTAVPQPNNRGTEFGEPPSFPRIDMWSDAKASRGNHEPVWQVTDNGEIVEPLGTSGVYTDPYGALITGASKLGSVPQFSFFEVPEAPGTAFEVFPGAPAVTDGATLVFKGNYSVNAASRTGVYYRDLADAPIPAASGSLAPAGGTSPVVLIANNADTLIPGTGAVFGSTAPPSAANRLAVFAGFDNEESPTLGGIYLARLVGSAPPLRTLVAIGSPVPGERRQIVFGKLGEGVSFDGRFVAFWGAWGSAVKTLNLTCPTEGNAERIAYCQELCGADPAQCLRTVPVNQGIFVHDVLTRQTYAVAKAPRDFSDFLFWNFSGHVLGMGEGDHDGEPARWRSTAFVAVSGLVDGSHSDAAFHAAFKARTGALLGGAYVSPVDGIYLRRGPGQFPVLKIAETGMDGTLLDPDAVDDVGEGLPITEMGLERDGFRGSSLVINASMGSEETGWAGVYLTHVPAR